MPRQPSRSINIVTAEELPVLTSLRSAKTIERRKRHKPDTQVTLRNPFHEETKPHLTKQSYPRTRVNSIKQQGWFHFQPEEMHPLESIMMRKAKWSVLLKLLYWIVEWKLMKTARLDVVFYETKTQMQGISLGSDQMQNEVLPKAASLKTSCKG